jgi:hypothetical protein
MKALRWLKSAWRCWCDLWKLEWEHHTGINPSKWESKMEIRRRLGTRRT